MGSGAAEEVGKASRQKPVAFAHGLGILTASQIGTVNVNLQTPALATARQVASRPRCWPLVPVRSRSLPPRAHPPLARTPFGGNTHGR